jgi:aminopeptidase N
MDCVIESIKYFTEYFEEEYQLPKLDVIFIPEMEFGGVFIIFY